jgi:1-phosphatidylinositol-3-phosphate 5-kinase
MPSSQGTGRDRDSPSASSVFLPLGKKSRRDSRSSLAHELDQDALKHALNSIHTAASQSSDLTVFNDYTDPPNSSSAEGKSLASEIQGGISGLYNKIRQTVGVASQGDEPRPQSQSLLSTVEDFAKKRSSPIVTSEVSSPHVAPSDSASQVDRAPTKISSQVPSTKPSVPSTPALRSPTGPTHPPSHILDPSVTSINIHAVASTNHSRTGSNLENDSPQQRSLAASTDSDSLRKALQKPAKENSLSDRSVSLLTSPATAAKGGNSSHERELLQASAHSHINQSDGLVSPTSITSPHEEKTVTRISTHKIDAAPQHRNINPLELLAENAPPGLRGHAGSHTKNGEPASLKSPLLLPSDHRPTESLVPKISQSRLPGFHASRTTSSDSGVSAGVLRTKLGQLEGGAPNISVSRSPQDRPLSKLRSKLLGKEFWMRDENAKDCFHCGEPFTTFRRKHHCRTCGQIFDNKCTVLINGSNFGSSSAVRVCKPCDSIINSHDDDSSDYSAEDVTLNDPATRPRTPEQPPLNRALTRFDDDNISVMSQSLEQMARTPTMNFPVRRAFDGANRTSAILEFDVADRPLTRPTSSRSLKASHSIGHGHKRHHSRHQHFRNFKAYHDDIAPFQRRGAEEAPKDFKSSAFHRDSIIDPDLAQYLSDDPSSEEEDQSISEALESDKLSRSGPENDKSAIGGLLAAVRKGRSRLGDRTIAGFLMGKDLDDASMIGPRNVEVLRGSRKRNPSVSSSIHRGTPRTTRERLQILVPSNQDDIQDGGSDTPSTYRGRSRMIRSASMHGVAAPAMELNRASIQHVHRMLQQVLKDAGVPNIQRWEEALIPILLKATDDVDPDVLGGDDMDIRNYVKLKKVPGGRPEDTSYISGLVFTKNVALKSMARSLTNPRILIITFSIEYARHEQHFMSLDPVIRQEKEYLANLVGRIAALKPDLLLAQRNISGLALELLDKAKITTIFNVKSSVLEAVSRCTQARVAHTMDKLTSLHDPYGTCDSFEIRTFVSGGRRKTYVYLSGCPPQLGCTIALRGSDRQTLSKVKRVTEFMVYVVYNLKLETCLMRDEFALIPGVPSADGTAAPAAQQDSAEPDHNQVSESEKPSEAVADVSATENIPDSADISNAEIIALEKEGRFGQSVRHASANSVQIPDDVPVPTFYEDLVLKHETRILSASPFVRFMQPYLLMRARELERRVAYLKRLRDEDMSVESKADDKSKTTKFTLITPEMVHKPPAGASRKVREIIHAVHSAEYEKAAYNYGTQKRQWETYLSGNRNLFDPFAHQNIVVLYSLVATNTSVPCTGPDLLAFSFYNENELEAEFEADCTLGQFVEDLCYRAMDTCHSHSCEKLMHEHHRQYVHGEAQITVFVQPYPAKMRGYQDVILMWSQCKICGDETTVTPMSSSTWKYSFGKYLELGFWSADLHPRAGVCPHDLHRDHLRYFGLKDFALRVHYDAVDLLEIIVPRMRLTWKVDNDLKFRNDIFTRIEHRITKFMVSVKLRLKNLNMEAVEPEKFEACRNEIDRLTKKANEEHASLIKHLQERYTSSRYWETIPLNSVVRATQEKVSEWDDAFTDFEKSYFPSEKDIRRLATLQLQKIFLDRDVSVSSLKSDDDGTITPPVEEVVDEKGQQSEAKLKPQRPSKLSPQKTETFLQSVLEEHSMSPPREPDIVGVLEVTRSDVDELPTVLQGPRDVENVRHLDLAVEPEAQAPGPLTAHNLPPVTATSPKTGPEDMRETLTSTSRGSVLYQKALQPPNDSPLPPLQPTGLPPPTDATPIPTPRRAANGRATSPALARAHSQPIGSAVLKGQIPGVEIKHPASSNLKPGLPKSGMSATNGEGDGSDTEKKLSDRLGFTALRNKTFAKGQSLIPRAVSYRKNSRVSNLAKHFEQLSREFERERVRERRLRAARNRESRIYPLAISKPIVEVFRDVDEAVDEKENSDDVFGPTRVELDSEVDQHEDTARGMAQVNSPEVEDGMQQHDDNAAETTEHETDVHASAAPSEVDDESDEEAGDEIYLPDSPEDLMRISQEDMDLKELPKHERTSLMKMLTNFWAERSSSGWTPLDYPLGASEHVFADCDILVREDEPSSIIAFALDSEDYKGMLNGMQSEPPQDNIANEFSGHEHADQSEVMHSLLRKTGRHLKYQFQEGPAKMLCKVFFAEQFDAVRRKCGVADRFVESLSRCLKWDSKGGKTKSLFLKTLDDRFILKSLSPIETQSFIKFAPNYFQIMSEAFFHELPSVIAKMFGFYQIIVKNSNTGLEYNWFLLVMENLFYDRIPTRIFDLKGSMRNRKMNATGEAGEVLLDENMVEFIYESPLFAREHSKKLLRSSVHNDTLFLARQNVMDYSLMVAIDENRKELVVGIIDCIRTYTWDKKLESWIKDRGLVPMRGGGNKNRPTVTSPREYKKRFREAMNRYVLEAPNCWHQFRPVAIGGARVERKIVDREGKVRGVRGLEVEDGDGDVLRTTEIDALT